MRFDSFVAVALTATALLAGPQVMAGTMCDSYPDATFCDSFDTYCLGENNPCSTSSTQSPGMMRATWPRTSVNYRLALNEDGTLQGCGAQLAHEDNQQYLVSVPYGGRVNNMGDENGDLGQATKVLTNEIHGRFGSQYDQFVARDTEDPNTQITLSFMMNSGTKSAAGLFLSHGFLELALEEKPHKKSNYIDLEVAPADYIMVGAEEIPDCSSCRGLCAAMLLAQGMPDDGRAPHVMWPTVCQSYHARTASSLCPNPADPTGPKIPCGPPYCPEVPVNKIHQTLAIGAFAMLDPNPCHCENPVKPAPCPGKPAFPDYMNHTTMVYHLALFDGWKWRILGQGSTPEEKYGPGATGSGDFRLGAKHDWVTLTIKQSTVKITHWSRQWVKYVGDPKCEPDATRNDAVVEIAITNPGSGYVSAPAVTITPAPSGGIDATAVATISGGAVDSITITTPGKGYLSPPAVTIEPPPGGGTQATATATLGGAAYLADWVASEVDNIPRMYTGAFNALRIGNPPSCLLKNDVYDCVQWAGTKCHNMTGGDACVGGAVDDGSNFVNFDNLVLQGGVGYAGEGACCQPDATCVITDDYTCTNLLHGRYNPGVTECAAGTCPCPIPYADADHDGDVDQDDFGAYQLCYNGEGAVPTGCGCYDRNGDSKVDALDLTSFSNCFTGPNVPWSSSVTPNCVP